MARLDTSRPLKSGSGLRTMLSLRLTRTERREGLHHLSENVYRARSERRAWRLLREEMERRCADDCDAGAQIPRACSEELKQDFCMRNGVLLGQYTVFESYYISEFRRQRLVAIDRMNGR